ITDRPRIIPRQYIYQPQRWPIQIFPASPLGGFGGQVACIRAESLTMSLAMHTWNRSVTKLIQTFTFGSLPVTAARRFRIREQFTNTARAGRLISPRV